MSATAVRTLHLMKCKSLDITALKLPYCHPLNQPPLYQFYLLCFLFGVGTFVLRVIALLNSIVIVFVVGTLFQSVAHYSLWRPTNYVRYKTGGYAVVQLVEALRYKPEGRGFDSRWCHWNFSLAYPSGRTMTLGSTQPLTEMSIRNIS